MEALLQRAIDQHNLPLTTLSFGIAAADGAPASKRAQNAAKEMGLDLSSHRSRSFGSIGNPAVIDRFYVMTTSHANTLKECAIDPAKIIVVAEEDGGVPDPFGRDHQVYLATAAVLSEAVDGLIDEFKPTEEAEE
jgi:protein-tyrosine-phosphatase